MAWEKHTLFTLTYSNQVLSCRSRQWATQSSHPSKNTSMPSPGSSHAFLSQGPGCVHSFGSLWVTQFKCDVIISRSRKSLTLDHKADETQTLASVLGCGFSSHGERYVRGHQIVTFLAIKILGRTIVFIRYLIHNSFLTMCPAFRRDCVLHTEILKVNALIQQLWSDLTGAELSTCPVVRGWREGRRPSQGSRGALGKIPGQDDLWGFTTQRREVDKIYVWTGS